MQKLFIHVGLPKTGSTSIQNFCLTHQAELRQRGLFYPPVEEGTWGHSHISTIRHEGPENASWVRRNLKTLIMQCKDSNCENILISEEIFCEHLCSDFADLIQQFETKILVYLRSPILLEHSAIQFEAFSFLFDSRSPIGISPLGTRDHSETCMYRVHATLYKLRSNWLNHFEKSQIIFKDFDGIIQNGDLLSDFLNTFGLSDMDVQPTPRINDSLKAPYLLFHSHANTIPLTWSERVRLYENLLELSRQDIHVKNYRFLSDAQLASVSKDAIAFFEEIGSHINKPDFYQCGLKRLQQLDYLPYRNLPAHMQHDIFSRLEPDVREAISRAWWKIGTVPNTQSLFPDLPETKEDLQNLSAWHRQLNIATR